MKNEITIGPTGFHRNSVRSACDFMKMRDLPDHQAASRGGWAYCRAELGWPVGGEEAARAIPGDRPRPFSRPGGMQISGGVGVYLGVRK